MSARKYVVIDVDEVDDIDFSQVCARSADVLRRNVDPANTKALVKFRGSKPRCLYGKDGLTLTQARDLMKTPEWSHDLER